MRPTSKNLGDRVSNHCVKDYRKRVYDGPEKRNATSNDLRKIIRNALNKTKSNPVVDFGNTQIYNVKFRKQGKPYYLITIMDVSKGRVVESIYTEEMYKSKYKNYP
jgi:hypothetical protein